MDGRTTLESTSDVIAALGGTSAVARLTGRQKTAVSNWKRPGVRFPANTFLTLTGALKAIGRAAPETLWGMSETSRHKKERAA